MPPDDGEWSFCQQWSESPSTQEVEVSCSIRMLTAETTKRSDNMNRILSSSTKQYSFITRSPRICRSKSMTREYIYFPIISSNSDNPSKSWLRNVKSLPSLQAKDEKQMLNEKLKIEGAIKKIGKENEIFDVMHSEDNYRDTLAKNLSPSPSPTRFERNRLTASDRNIGYKFKNTKTKTRRRSVSNEELNKKDAASIENLPNLYETKDQRKPGKKIKRTTSLRAWNPPSNKKPVLSSFKSDYNVLEPKTVVSLSHQFETTTLPNKTSFPNKKKIELYDTSEVKKRRRIQTEPVIKKNGDDNTKIRANSLPDENIYSKVNKAELSPKSVKSLKSDWEKKLKAEECLSQSMPTSPNHILNSQDPNIMASNDENFIQSARQIQVLKEYKQRASTSVSNLKNQFEVFSTPSPNILKNCGGSNKSNKHFEYEKYVDETPTERSIPRIVTSSIKSIRMQFEQQSLNKNENSVKVKPAWNISPSKPSPILNLVAKFDPSISCSSQGRESTTSNGSFSDNDVFSYDENLHSKKDEMESDIFVSRLKEKKIQDDNYLKQLEKQKEEELKRLKEHRDREAIMAEKREVERQKKLEEEREKEQREKEREQERRRIEAEREIQRKRLEEEKKKEELKKSFEKEKQRIAIEEEVKKAKKLREDEQRKETEEREKLELKRIEEEKEIEEFEREKLVEARELMEAELQKEKVEKLKAEEENMIKLQRERGIYSDDVSEGVSLEADVDNLINKFEKSPRENYSDNESSPRSDRRPLSRGGSTQSLSNCRPLNPDEMQLFMGMTTSESFMRTQSLRVKPKRSKESRMKRSNSMSEKSSPMLIPNKPSTSMGPPVVKSVPSNCRQLRPEEWKFFLGDMTSSKECDFDFSDSE